MEPSLTTERNAEPTWSGPLSGDSIIGEWNRPAGSFAKIPVDFFLFLPLNYTAAFEGFNQLHFHSCHISLQIALASVFLAGCAAACECCCNNSVLFGV